MGKSKTRGRLQGCQHQRLPPTAWHDGVGGEGPGITFASPLPPPPTPSGQDRKAAGPLLLHPCGTCKQIKSLGRRGGMLAFLPALRG